MGKAVSENGTPKTWVAWLAALVLAPLLLAALGLAWPRPGLESDLTDRSDVALRSAGVTGASVSFDGRDATLADVPAGQELLALDAVRGVDGVRVARMASSGSSSDSSATSASSPSSAASSSPSATSSASASAPSSAAASSVPASASSPASSVPASSGSAVPPAPSVDKVAVQGMLDALLASATIGFLPDSAQLTPQGVTTVARAAEILRAAPGVRVEIGGHVGVAPGGAENAQRLSEARALTVRDALVAAGIPTDSLVPRGYGDTRPKPDLVASRRVEITVL